MKYWILLSLSLGSVATAAGCEHRSAPLPDPISSASPQLDEAPRPAPGATEITLSGKVVEKLSVPSYSYLRLDTGTDTVWTAVPTSSVAVGELVTVERAMLMSGFRSTALKRDFDRVYFGTLRGGAMDEKPSAHGAAAPAVPAPPIPKGLAKASGPGGKTVEQVIAGAKTLVSSRVAVRGVVVKANPGILGKTWIHLRDGSGREADETHDLTATLPATETPRVGEVVTVRGTIAVDQDVGGGYRFPVLLEGTELERAASE